MGDGPRARLRFAIIGALAALGTAWAVLTPNPCLAMTYAERLSLDLRSYVVRNPNAGLFDVTRRRAYLSGTDDPILRQLTERLSVSVGCRDKTALPVVNYIVRLPRFNARREAWEKLVQPIFAFENAVNDLAAAHLVAPGDGHGRCLIDLLSTWAGQRAFIDFDYAQGNRQAWFQVASALFSAASAYAIVRPDITGRDADMALIEVWLRELMRVNLAYEAVEGEGSSCCNNHLYRRGLAAAMVGVVLRENRFFRHGVSAIYAALDDARYDGALRQEMRRGALAAHYQNYGVLHLITLAQVIYRQGYNVFELSFRGARLGDLVAFNRRFLENPQAGRALDAQSFDFLDDDQYFGWMEIALRHVPSGFMRDFAAPRRPLYNRDGGGHLTLFFYTPEVRP